MGDPVAEQMVSLLRYANYAKVARDLDVSRQTVMRWSRGEGTTPWQLRRVRELFGVADTVKEPRPEWAEALPGEVADAVVRLLGGPEIEALRAELALEPRPLAPPPVAARQTATRRPRDTRADSD